MPYQMAWKCFFTCEEWSVKIIVYSSHLSLKFEKKNRKVINIRNLKCWFINNMKLFNKNYFLKAFVSVEMPKERKKSEFFVKDRWMHA